MTTRVSLPGMRSPGAGFDQPFEMLDACHDRVRRSLDLLRRLRDYLRGHGHGCDDSARQAARDVLRYFDLAAPLHHDDEELNIFPVVLAQGSADAISAVATLLRDHQAMHALWQRLRLVLMVWSQPGATTPASESMQALVADFVASYASHIRTEEDLVYPQARALMSAAQIAEISQQMRARRQG